MTLILSSQTPFTDARRRLMPLQETLGDRLTQAMKRAGLKNPDVATAAGVHETTVSRWRTDVQVPDDAELVPVVALLRRKGLDDATVAWLRYGAEPKMVRERPMLSTDYEYIIAPDRMFGSDGTVWLTRFLNDLIEEGADGDFLNWARHFLTTPGNYALYAGGTREPMTDEQRLRHMQGLAVGVRAILKERQKKRR